MKHLLELLLMLMAISNTVYAAAVLQKKADEGAKMNPKLVKKEVVDTPLRNAAHIGVAGLAIFGALKGAGELAKHANNKKQVEEARKLSAEAASLSEFRATFVRPTVTITESPVAPSITSDASLVMALGHTSVVNGQTVFIAQSIKTAAT